MFAVGGDPVRQRDDVGADICEAKAFIAGGLRVKMHGADQDAAGRCVAETEAEFGWQRRTIDWITAHIDAVRVTSIVGIPVESVSIASELTAFHRISLARPCPPAKCRALPLAVSMTVADLIASVEAIAGVAQRPYKFDQRDVISRDIACRSEQERNMPGVIVPSVEQVGYIGAGI